MWFGGRWTGVDGDRTLLVVLFAVSLQATEPQFVSKAVMKIPEGYRDWVFVGSNLGFGYSEAKPAKTAWFTFSTQLFVVEADRDVVRRAPPKCEIGSEILRWAVTSRLGSSGNPDVGPKRGCGKSNGSGRFIGHVAVGRAGRSGLIADSPDTHSFAMRAARHAARESEFAGGNPPQITASGQRSIPPGQTNAPSSTRT